MDISNTDNNWVFFVGAIIIMIGIIVVPIIIYKMTGKEE